MSIHLENEFLQVLIEPENSVFHVHSKLIEGAEIKNARISLRCMQGRRKVGFLNAWKPYEVLDTVNENTVHGKMKSVTLLTPILEKGKETGVTVKLTFGVIAGRPGLSWRIEIVNESDQPVYPAEIELLNVGFLTLSSVRSTEYVRGKISLPGGIDHPAFFSNGWGSWDDTRSYYFTERFRRTRLGFITRPMRQNPGTPHPRRVGHFGSDMFGVLGERPEEPGDFAPCVLVGFLSQREHFGSVEVYLAPGDPALSLWANGDGAQLNPGAAVKTDWAYMQFVDSSKPDPLGDYYEAVAVENQVKLVPNKMPSTGWCSWYHYFQEISENAIRDNLDVLKKDELSFLSAASTPGHPEPLVQIDDGYQAEIGDWLRFKPEFTNGVQPLADAVHESKMLPGLWIAPFTVHPRSRVYREHPEWLLKGRWGRPVNAGYNWGALHTALDLTHPGAQAYVREVIETAVDRWGYPYLKLDFLYAGALKGRPADPTKTRAQVLREALEMIRQVAGEETVLLGCGCPLGSGIGIFDAMRIGPDVAPEWYPKQMGFRKPIREEPGMPSARNAIHSMLTRSGMHLRWWVNDPDCLLLRPETELTLAEVGTLATAIALTGGPLLVSDDLTQLPTERLKIARQLLPVLNSRPDVLDWFQQSFPALIRLDRQSLVGSWTLIGLINWEDQPAMREFSPDVFGLDPNQHYYVRSFWTEDVFLLSPEEALEFPLKAHGCALLAVRKFKDKPLYLGGDFHVSQGDELVEWNGFASEVNMVLERPGTVAGHFDLALPAPPAEVESDQDAEAAWEEIQPGVYRFRVSFADRVKLRIVLRNDQ